MRRGRGRVGEAVAQGRDGGRCRTAHRGRGRRGALPGLGPLRADDADLFFGRRQLTDRLLELARSRRFTAVFGPSVSGESCCGSSLRATVHRTRAAP
ncbi:hypothetical protein [Streptomyces naphthomycinicus]|uniref:nSTAND1 domain-containing NTPase n=1 Tax=Streptomyces naphthomycinicus TaxID=2872625 RepID=UPI003082DC3B